MSEKIIFSMQHVTKVVPPKRSILKNINLSFFYGAKIGVLGLNGAGKSTLLKVIAGLDTNIQGEIQRTGEIKFGYLSQEPELDANKDVRGNIEDGVAEIKGWLKRFDEISQAFMEPMSDDEMNALLTEQGELQAKIDTANAWELDRQLDMAAQALRLPPWDADVSKLSGGEKRRVALCRLLLEQPDVLLLDEPTNHLDAESVAWLEQFLHNYKGTVIAVTHDRYFLDNVAGWILELDRGEGIPFKGNYTAWLEQKEQRLAVEEKQEAAKARAIKEELEWVRTQSKGRHAKSKARLQRFAELNDQNYQTRNETRELYIPPGPRLGDKVIEIQHLKKGFGDRVLIDDLDCIIPPGAIVGIIGPNGAGKSTFFKLLAGKEQPDGGNIDIGETVELAHIDQERDGLQAGKTVWEEISDGLDVIQVGKYETPSRSYVGRFNFKGSDQQKFVDTLSGGERGRVHLAKLLRKGGNVLLLDEPSNDLDVETLRALEGAILSFPGCVFVISHDRWFLDRIATHMLAFNGDGHVEWYAGNYQDYMDYKAQQQGG